jgi:hypothetical protein
MAGLTIDLARGYMTPRMARWMETQLLVLHIQGLVEVEEEHRQLCFHIMVAKKYGDPNRVIIEIETPQILMELELIPDVDSPSTPEKAESNLSDSHDTSTRKPLSGDAPLAGPRLYLPRL